MEVLTAEDKKAIVQALKDCAELRKEIARAKRAGIDVSSLEAELNTVELQLKQIESVYVRPKSA